MLTHVLQPQHSGAVVPFVDMSALVQTYFIRSRYYDGVEKALFPNKCFVITIALYLHAFHLCSLFHSFACVPCTKRTNLVDLGFPWNHEPKQNVFVASSPRS